MSISIISIIIFAILIFAFYSIVTNLDLRKKLSWNIFSDPLNKNKDEELATKDLARRIIDGVYVKKGQENLLPYAIVIDNHADARPAKGIDKANLVIETEAEGGITRYLAIFASNDEITEIGPVRSARPYFVDWAQEFSSFFVHSGGSPEALIKIARSNLIDINEFYNGASFWRDKSRSRPHNIFTSKENLEKINEDKDFDEGKFFSWQFKKDLDFQERPQESIIKVNYILPSYLVSWHYDKTQNSYLRYLANLPHTNDEGEVISAKNVIIQYIPAQEIDEELRLKMETIGEGEALVCLDGACQESIWKNNNASSRTRFYTEDNNEIEFNAGKIWINVVRPNYKVEY